jgi:formate-dependent nitrite reductase membrane component NrfD
VSAQPTPALGTRGEPGIWKRARAGARVALSKPRWADARWSYLFGRGDTSYAAQEADRSSVAESNRRGRDGELDPDAIIGPMMNPAVWTWEVPLYFWTGGIAAGSSFVALACDLSGDHRSARIARLVSLGALGPSPLLLILDLGRPERFLNMLRIFKPRSPMSMGVWALTLFGNLAAAGVAADILKRDRAARAIGAANAVVGGYVGSYTGVLLASTAVPLWARSKLFLGPIFVSTATATGAAAVRLALDARGLPPGHPTRRALGHVETVAMSTELALSTINERRIGEGFKHTRLFQVASWSVRAGLALRLSGRAHRVSSGLFLAGGLAFRYAWVRAGHDSARDDLAVAQMARRR